jgi:hypothetical protein
LLFSRDTKAQSQAQSPKTKDHGSYAVAAIRASQLQSAVS